MLFLGLTEARAQQRTEPFAEDQKEFMKQFGEFFTQSKTQVMNDLYKDFESAVKKQIITTENLSIIRATCNKFIELKLSANPYFKAYIECMLVIKNRPQHAANFNAWHDILNQIVADVQNRKFNQLEDYMSFSRGFFEMNAFRTSPGSHSWLTGKDKYQMKYENKDLSLVFDDLDLTCIRKNDSIVISSTKGTLKPFEQTWKGQGGKVDWRRSEVKEIFAELDTYILDLKKNEYTAENVLITYPSLFPGQKIKGRLTDKVVVANKATEGSYPRFESYEKILDIKDIGGGIIYKGGFRLEGTSVYGSGDKENKAQIWIKNSANKTVFTGTAETFIIRKGERVAADRVRSVIYFDEDSVYHLSLNLKFDIKQKEMTLERGTKGNDRSPIFDTYHKVDISADKFKWLIDKDSIIIGEKSIAFAKSRDEVVFESDKYFDEIDYRRIQSIGTTNPIANLRIATQNYGRNMDVETAAKAIDPKFSLSNIQSLLYEMLAKGFVNYDPETGQVEIRDKTIHYADASQKKVDYETISILSKTLENNAEWSLKTGKINVFGVDKVEFSRFQRVALKPLNDKIVLKKNRDMDFNGKLYAGYSTFTGKKFHFVYDKYQIEMDSVRFFDLFIPTGEKDKNGIPVANPIESRIENTFGVLNIDAPSNKSGVQDLPAFPSYQSKGLSYVFYDRLAIYDGVYKRDSFYFELDKFSFQGLDKIKGENINLKGRMFSTNIFPVFNETLSLQEDQSLGYLTKTPADGFPVYVKKGVYKGNILLSNAGLQGKGNLRYIKSNFDSDDILFRPKILTASAQQFNIDEGKEGNALFPKVNGQNVLVDWRPYQDSMYIRTKEKAFTMFREGIHTLKGLLIMTPQGLKARGQLNWEQGLADAKVFNFGLYNASSDTMDLKIRAVNSDDLAFDTKNIRGILDFENQKGSFVANSENISTTMPYNKYSTSMNEFEWDMKNETITFKADPNKPAVFRSFAEDQDSLSFRGKTAFYDLKTNLLKIGGVDVINSCDAYIYPESGDIEIKKGGEMSTLNNASILADTITKFHTITKATVDIKGKKLYTAKGFYQYNIKDKEQEIFFDNIIGQRVGKGKKSQKATLTTAEANLTDSLNFYLGPKMRFYGKMKLTANKKDVGFDGFANIESPLFKEKNWFSIDNEVNRDDVRLYYNKSKNPDGNPVRSGFFLSKSTAQLYPRFMMPTYMRKDRPILDVTGYIINDAKKDKFVVGDSAKVFTNAMRGRRISITNYNNKVEAEGPLSFGSGLKYVNLQAAGKIESEFAVIDTTLEADKVKLPPVNIQTMLGIELTIPEVLLTAMVNDLRTSTFESNFIDYNRGFEFYDHAMSEFITDDAVLTPLLSTMKARTLELPKEFKKFSLFFSKLNLIWDADYSSFVSSKDVNGLAAINGEMLNKMVTSSVEIKMPSNEDDRLYIYIKGPNENFYFFGYSQGILSVTSNNTVFTDAFLKLKKKELVYKKENDETYEIQAVSPETADLFVQRAKAAGKPKTEN